MSPEDVIEFFLSKLVELLYKEGNKLWLTDANILRAIIRKKLEESPVLIIEDSRKGSLCSKQLKILLDLCFTENKDFPIIYERELAKLAKGT